MARAGLGEIDLHEPSAYGSSHERLGKLSGINEDLLVGNDI